MPPGNIALRLDLREPRKGIDNVLLPRRRHHARRCDRTLFAVRPGFLPCWVAASSWTQSRKSRISFRPSFSSGTAPPHRVHFRSVFEYSSWVRCAGFPERKVLYQYGFESRRHRWSPTPPATATLPDPFRPVALCLCVLPSRRSRRINWADLDGPRPRVIGRIDSCTQEKGQCRGAFEIKGPKGGCGHALMRSLGR